MGFGAYGLRFRVWRLGGWGWGLGFRGWGVGLMVRCSGLKVSSGVGLLQWHRKG